MNERRFLRGNVMNKLNLIINLLIALLLTNCQNIENQSNDISNIENTNPENEINGNAFISENQTFIVPSDAPNGEYVGQI
jgi:outer membrane lipoprotein SlyB